MIKFVRTIVLSVAEAAIKRFSGSGRPGETFTNREFMQQYGFSSRPLDGAEGLVLIQGNQIFLIASDDSRYRIEIQDGEVILYTDEGDYILLGRDNIIYVSTENKLQVNAASEVEINAPTITLSSDTIAKIISAVVNIGAESGHKALTNEDLITLFNSHTHGGVQPGLSNTNAPNQQAGAAHKTANLKAT